MAKPIFIVKVSVDVKNFKDIKEKLQNQLTDYHVVVINFIEYQQPSFECFNDCKGLPDIDIEKLINDLK